MANPGLRQDMYNAVLESLSHWKTKQLLMIIGVAPGG